MHYLDTSLLVAALTLEAASADAREWLAAQPLDSMVISDWVITEFSSALSIKVSTGALQSTHRQAALAAFGRMSRDTLDVLPVGRRAFSTAAGFANRAEVGVRGADALHLAVAAEHDADVVTFDRRLALAGQLLDLPTTLLELKA